MSISAQDRDRIASAIHAAEARTTGEIVCVLARSTSDASGLAVLVAAIAAFALPWLLVAFTAMTVYLILSLQILLFAALVSILLLTPLRVALLPSNVRRAVAHRAAAEQFLVRRIARKKDRTGILIFVSLAERYARIIADDAIAARVPQSEWQSAIDALIGHAREGQIADGYIKAIERCGDALATHFPRTAESRGELPDKIYVI